MEKKQYELCLEILRRLSRVRVLNNIVLIGSWCIPFYKEYFAKVKYVPSIRTRDIDFLIPVPSRIQKKVDIPELVKDLGFVIGFKGPQGYIRLEHPKLFIEFLVPEKGKGTDKPYPLPKLGVNAIALRFLNFLSENTIKIKIEDFYLTLPHPANFSLHKLIVFQRRIKRDKAIKDRNIAIRILKALINKGEVNIINEVFDSVPQKWQKKIVKGLEKAKEKEILDILR
ncbi:hypothetical protein ES705_01725 [subsurface metagenome]|nr:hypothetical protein [Clostridia bacterium]